MPRKESYKAKLARSAKATRWVDDLGASKPTHYPDSIWLADIKQKEADAFTNEKWNNASEWDRKQMLFPVIMHFINDNQDCNWGDLYNELNRENYHTELELLQRFNAPRVSNIYQHEFNKHENQDSVWFDTNSGDWPIVEYVVDNRFKVVCRAVGDISIDVYDVKKDRNGKVIDREYIDSVSNPESADIYNDGQLQAAISSQRIEFQNNNWFSYDIVDLKTNEYITDIGDDTVLDDLDACFDFDYPIQFIDLYKKQLKEQNKKRGN